jgi:photosystem II stability/assembly factor-like uncharacterized protein
MKTLKIIFFSFLSCICCRAQWELQQVPTTNTLYDVYFADSSEGWVTASYDGIFHTSNGGNTWDQQFPALVYRLSGISNTELWATSRKDTLLHTTNGGVSWTKITINEFTDFDSTRSFYTIYFFNRNIGWTQVDGWISGGIQGRLLKTTDGGITWEMITDPWLSSDAFIQFFDSLYGYRTGSGLPFFRTTDGGETWDLVSWYGYMSTYDMQFINKYIGWISIDGPVSSTAAIKTTNGGENWPTGISCDCGIMYFSFIDTLKGWIANGGEILYTSDGGAIWNLQFTYSPPFFYSPKKISFVDSLNGWIIGAQGKILHTSTGGVIAIELTSFTASVLQNEKAVKLNWATATETNDSGFEIQRNGDSPLPGGERKGWVNIGFVPGFGTTTEPKTYSFIDEDITTGIYKYRLKQIDFDGSFTYSNEIEVEVDFTPKEFVLYQNYPNPFNPSTTISWQSPVSSWQTLKVFDVIGNEVVTLVDEYRPAGKYEIEFSAKGGPESSIKYPASGIYFYQLKVGNFVDIKKMILLR